MSSQFFSNIGNVCFLPVLVFTLLQLANAQHISCGSRPSASNRIVGGSVAKVNSWPWQVMLIVRSSGNQFCGGSLVDRYWVVTAAHCVNGIPPSFIKVKLGAHYRTIGNVGTEQEIGVAQIIRHESYNNPLRFSNDIALIKLLKPANLGIGIGLVCLPDKGHALPFDNLNKKCWITGWGTLSSGGSHPNTLMEAMIPLVSKRRCLNSYPRKIDYSMLCAGLDAGGVDACQGDSGGPLVCEFDGTWFLEGVTSWGQGCAYASKYGVYAKVRELKAWITSHIYRAIPPAVSPQNQSVSALVGCTFDNGLCSGWSQSASDDFDWTLSSGSTPSASTGPSSGQGGSGNYMYIETSSPRRPGDKAKLVLTIPNNGEMSCLSFYYHMYGASVGTLNVYSGNSKVFYISGQQSNYWIMVERNIILNGLVIFEGIAGNSFTGDIAIDSVEIDNGNCPANAYSTPTAAGSTLPPSTYSSENQHASTTPTEDGSTLQPSTYSPENQHASTTPTEDGSTIQPSTYSPEKNASKPTPSADGSTFKPSTPSNEAIRKSVLLKVNNMDIKKWNRVMEYSFKREVAAAAREYCAQVQCFRNQSRRRRSHENVNFTADMVHILPGYPNQSDDPPGVILLAFYLSFPQGISESNIVPERVLHGIVMGHKENIQTSIGGEITSVGPLPSGTEQLKDEESDKGNGGKSKLTNVIIGASVGGGLLLIIIAAVLIGCKKTDRFSHNRRVTSREELEHRDAACKVPVSTSSRGNVDHIHAVEQAVEIREDVISSSPNKIQPPRADSNKKEREAQPKTKHSVEYLAEVPNPQEEIFC